MRRNRQLGHAVLYVVLLFVGLVIGAVVAAYLFWPVMVLVGVLPLPDGRAREFAGAFAYFLWMLIPFAIAHIFSLTLFNAMTKSTVRD